MRCLILGLPHLAATLAASLALAAPAAAQSYGAQVVASGLNNPRGLAFDGTGTLYIAEAGYADPAVPATAPLTVYNTGSITTLSGVTQQVLVSGLPSNFNGEAITGPSDIVFRDGTGYVLIGLGSDPANRPAGSRFGSLVSFTGGGAPTVFDISAFEAANNPVDTPDSNPFHVAATASGFLVTDAGGNTLLNVAPSGTVSQVAQFPNRYIPPPPPLPPGAFPPVSQSVPTGIAVAPDGTIYVAELTGVPFTPGYANIYSIDPVSRAVNIYASGLTDLTALAFGADGALYALEYDIDGIILGGNTGALVRVGPGTTSQVVYTGELVNPTGLAVGADGAFYVANNSAGGAGAGTVLRIAAVPEPAGWMTMIAGFGAIGVMVRRRRREAVARA